MEKDQVHKKRMAKMNNHATRLRWHVRTILFCLGILVGNFEAFAADNAQLISVSVPTNTTMAPGNRFTQTWTLKNTGTTTWSAGQSGYTLTMVGKDSLGAVPLFTNASSTRYTPFIIVGNGKSVSPNSNAAFSMSFIAPISSGTYTDTFQMNNTSGVAFGPKVTVQIVVAQSGTNSYDRAKAVSYANNFDGYIVSDGYFWTDGSDYSYFGAGTPVPTYVIGDDCAHFCSSCIGSQPNQYDGGLTIPTRVPPTYGEPGAGRLINTVLIAHGYATEVSSLSELSPGDLIGWNWEGDPSIEDIDHVTLYVGNGLVASHAVSALDVSATTFFQSGEPDWVWHLIHIFDTSLANTPLMLQSPKMSPFGIFTFTAVGPPGYSCTLESSTDLVNWISEDTVDNTSGTVEFVLYNGAPLPNAHFYYRVMMSQ